MHHICLSFVLVSFTEMANSLAFPNFFDILCLCLGLPFISV